MTKDHCQCEADGFQGATDTSKCPEHRATSGITPMEERFDTFIASGDPCITISDEQKEWIGEFIRSEIAIARKEFEIRGIEIEMTTKKQEESPADFVQQLRSGDYAPIIAWAKRERDAYIKLIKLLEGK
jgi:hypothetical protein